MFLKNVRVSIGIFCSKKNVTFVFSIEYSLNIIMARKRLIFKNHKTSRMFALKALASLLPVFALSLHRRAPKRNANFRLLRKTENIIDISGHEQKTTKSLIGPRLYHHSGRCCHITYIILLIHHHRDRSVISFFSSRWRKSIYFELMFCRYKTKTKAIPLNKGLFPVLFSSSVCICQHCLLSSEESLCLNSSSVAAHSSAPAPPISMRNS